MGGRTVAEWQSVMSQREFMDWVAFYRAHPFDDRSRYLRPAALVAHSMGGADVQQLMEWLQPSESSPEGLTAADANTLKALGVTRPK